MRRSRSIYLPTTQSGAFKVIGSIEDPVVFKRTFDHLTNVPGNNDLHYDWQSERHQQVRSACSRSALPVTYLWSEASTVSSPLRVSVTPR